MFCLMPAADLFLERRGFCVTLILARCVDKDVSNFSYHYYLMVFLTCEILMQFCCSDEEMHGIDCVLTVGCFSCMNIRLFNLPRVVLCINLIFWSCEL